MAIETKNHACKRDSIKNLSTKEQTYDNGQGGTLSIRTKTKTKNRGGNPLKSTNNVFKKTIPITENQASFMDKLSLKPMNEVSIEPINLADVVVNCLAPSLIQSEGGI